METQMALQSHIEELSEKHKLLDRKIEQELASPSSDDVRIAELKRQKLKLKDEIEKLQTSRTRH